MQDPLQLFGVGDLQTIGPVGDASSPPAPLAVDPALAGIPAISWSPWFPPIPVSPADGWLLPPSPAVASSSRPPAPATTTPLPKSRVFVPQAPIHANTTARLADPRPSDFPACEMLDLPLAHRQPQNCSRTRSSTPERDPSPNQQRRLAEQEQRDDRQPRFVPPQPLAQTFNAIGGVLPRQPTWLTATRWSNRSPFAIILGCADSRARRNHLRPGSFEVGELDRSVTTDPARGPRCGREPAAAHAEVTRERAGAPQRRLSISRS